MTVRTYGKLPHTVAVLGAAEVMRDQRILYVWLRPQASLERLSGVPQVCERRLTRYVNQRSAAECFLRRRGHTDEIAVIRPLRTATRRSWQPGGFGDSCLPDGIFHGALDYRFVEVMPTPDAVSRSM